MNIDRIRKEISSVDIKEMPILFSNHFDWNDRCMFTANFMLDSVSD